MIRITINPDFNGPTLPEMAGLIGEGSGPLEVRWTGTPPEIGLAQNVRGRALTLVVEDVNAMYRAAIAVGAEFSFDYKLCADAVQVLNNRQATGWPEFTRKTGYETSRGVLVAVAASMVEQNCDNPPLRSVVDSCMFEGVGTSDADALLRLRTRL